MNTEINKITIDIEKPNIHSKIMAATFISSNQQDIFGVPESFCTVEKDPDSSGLEEMEDKAMARFCERHYALVEKLSDIGLPAKGEQFRLVTRRTFNSIQLLEFICKTETIIDLRMAIYSINYNAAIILINLIADKKIHKAEILMSNLRNSAHREKEEIIKKLFVDHPRVSLFFCSSHAKTFSCQTKEGNYYTIEGSGNMAYNSRVEQYVIDNDKGMYEFSVEWMREIKVFLENKKEFEQC